MLEETELEDVIEQGQKILVDKWMTCEDFKKYVENDKKLKDCIKKCTSPAKKDIFNAFRLFPMKDTKVLILGQDPYPEPDKAHGLAFSVKNKKKRAASLTKIFKAVEMCHKFNSKKRNYNLEEWACNEKILLLNTALTYEKTKTFEGEYKYKKDLPKNKLDQLEKDQDKIQKNHINSWHDFTKKVLENLFEEKKQNLVVFLWGEKAQKLFEECKYHTNIDNKKIFITCHPKKRFGNQFLNEASIHFKDCNDFLKKHNQEPIKWEGMYK